MFSHLDMVMMTVVEYVLAADVVIPMLAGEDGSPSLGDYIRNLQEFRRLGSEKDLTVFLTTMNLSGRILRFTTDYSVINVIKVGVERREPDVVIFHSEDHFIPCCKFDKVFDTCDKKSCHKVHFKFFFTVDINERNRYLPVRVVEGNIRFLRERLESASERAVGCLRTMTYQEQSGKVANFEGLAKSISEWIRNCRSFEADFPTQTPVDINWVCIKKRTCIHFFFAW